MTEKILELFEMADGARCGFDESALAKRTSTFRKSTSYCHQIWKGIGLLTNEPREKTQEIALFQMILLMRPAKKLVNALSGAWELRSPPCVPQFQCPHRRLRVRR